MMKFEMNVKGRVFEVEVTEENKVYATDEATGCKMLLTENGAYARKSGYRNSINKKFDFEELVLLDADNEEERKAEMEYPQDDEPEKETLEQVVGMVMSEEPVEEADTMEETIDPVIARCLPKYVNDVLTVGVKTDEGYRLVIESGQVVTAKKWVDARKQICGICKYIKEQAKHETTDEEMFEMRAAFGAGTKVVDVITGKEFQL